MEYRVQLLNLKREIDFCLKSLVDEEKNVKNKAKFEKFNESIKSKMNETEYAGFLKNGKTLLNELKNNKNLIQEVSDGGENALKPYKNFHRIFMGLSAILDAISVNIKASLLINRYGLSNIKETNPEILSMIIFGNMMNVAWLYEITNNSMNPNTPMGEFIEWCAKSLKRIVDAFTGGNLQELIISIFNYLIIGIFKNIAMFFKVATSNMVMGVGLFGLFVSLVIFLIKEYKRRHED